MTDATFNITYSAGYLLLNHWENAKSNARTSFWNTLQFSTCRNKKWFCSIFRWSNLSNSSINKNICSRYRFLSPLQLKDFLVCRNLVKNFKIPSINSIFCMHYIFHIRLIFHLTLNAPVDYEVNTKNPIWFKKNSFAAFSLLRSDRFLIVHMLVNVSSHSHIQFTSLYWSNGHSAFQLDNIVCSMYEGIFHLYLYNEFDHISRGSCRIGYIHRKSKRVKYLFQYYKTISI